MCLNYPIAFNFLICCLLTCNFTNFTIVVNLCWNYHNHTSQAVIDLMNYVDFNQTNLPDLLFQPLGNNVKPCGNYNFDNQALPFDSPFFCLFYT